MFRSGFYKWSYRSDGFRDWHLDGCSLVGRHLVLSEAARFGQPGARIPPEAGPVLVGQAISPALKPSFAAAAFIPSWNAVTPEGCWLEIDLQLLDGANSSPWYRLAIWTSRNGDIVERQSIAGQSDENATVDTDTLRCRQDWPEIRLRLRLCSTQAGRSPQVHLAGLAWSDPKPLFDQLPDNVRPGNPALWNRIINGVPCCSQMVYPDGGRVWCSPTCLSMLLGYWQKATGPCEPWVRSCVAGVYDAVYGGHGNWSFNVALAGSLGYEAQLVRCTSLADLEPWIAAAVPVVLSVSWNNSEGRILSNSPVDKSSGHLTLLVGFDAEGNPVMNEPASPDNGSVRRTYLRAELERCWLSASGAAAYLVYPEGHPVPALPGQT